MSIVLPVHCTQPSTVQSITIHCTERRNGLPGRILSHHRLFRTRGAGRFRADCALAGVTLLGHGRAACVCARSDDVHAFEGLDEGQQCLFLFDKGHSNVCLFDGHCNVFVCLMKDTTICLSDE